MENKPLSLENQLIGNYRLLTRIGGGGFGEVYRSEHAELGNPFAIKILHHRLSKDDQFVERFRHEAMVLAGLQHENVVQVVDFGQHGDVGFFLVMEWLEGRTLHRLWRQKRVLPLGKIYALFSQLLDALQLAHDNGIVHRDMKPENLILTQGGRGRTILKIVDFGIATIVGGGQKEGDPLNQRGMAIGTPYYMSPEQAAGRLDRVDHRSDLYACGVILAELMTGRRLFRSKDPKEILRQQIEVPAPTLQELNPNRRYPDSFQHILNKALAKRKSERYASATEFYEAIAAAMDAEGIAPIEDEPTHPSSPNMLASLVTGSPGTSSDQLESFTTGSQFNGQKSSSPQTSPPAISGAISQAIGRKSIQGKAFWLSLSAGLLIVALLGWQLLKPKSNLQPAGTPFEPVRVNPPTRLEPKIPKKITPKKRPPSSPTPPIVRPKERLQVRTRPPIRRKKAPTFWLSVKTTPSRAKIYVNGRYRGKSPKRIYLKKGKRFRIRVVRGGYETIKFRWRSNANSTRRLKLIEKLF